MERIASRWGVERRRRGRGKCVWFELALGHPVKELGNVRAAGHKGGFSAWVRPVQSVPVVEARGEEDLSAYARLLEAMEEAKARAVGPVAAIVVDLQATGFFDSMGIGVLLGATKDFRKRGGEVYLVTREGPCLRLIRVVELDRFFEIHPDLDSAVQAALSHAR